MTTTPFHGSVFALTLCDVCDEINLSQLPTLIPGKRLIPAFKHTTPEYVRFESPPVTESLGPIALDGGEQFEGTLPGLALLPEDPGGSDYSRCDRAVEAAVLSHQNVLQRGHAREETNGLKCAGNAALRDSIGTKPADALPVEQELARTRLNEPGDDIEEGGLSGSVRADEAGDRPLLDSEVNVGQGREALKVLGNRSRLQDGTPARVASTRQRGNCPPLAVSSVFSPSRFS